MKFKWGKTRIKGLAKRVPTAEKRCWVWDLVDKYLPIFVMITCIAVTVWIWVKICQLWKIHFWLESF